MNNLCDLEFILAAYKRLKATLVSATSNDVQLSDLVLNLNGYN